MAAVIKLEITVPDEVVVMLEALSDEYDLGGAHKALNYMLGEAIRHYIKGYYGENFETVHTEVPDGS